jgi:hypothetical protein
MSELRKIEREATEELERLRTGQFYEGKYLDVDRLERIIREARIEFLELELKNR